MQPVKQDFSLSDYKPKSPTAADTTSTPKTHTNTWVVHPKGNATCNGHTYSAWQVKALDELRKQGRLTESALATFVPDGKKLSFLVGNLKLMCRDLNLKFQEFEGVGEKTYIIVEPVNL